MRSLRFFGVFGCDSYVDGDDTEDVTTEVCVYGCPTADMLDSGDGELSAWHSRCSVDDA